MHTLQVIFDPHDTDQRRAAETLQHAGPAPHAVTLTPLPHGALPAPALDGTSSDVVLLLDPRHSKPSTPRWTTAVTPPGS